jgi:NagD protein
METDILGGVQLGFHTILVLSGGTRFEEISQYAYQPELIVESVATLADFLDTESEQPLWQCPENSLAVGEDGDAPEETAVARRA